MLYDNYQKKMWRVVQIFAKIRRFRVLIICVAAVLFALLTGFLATKGMVYGEEPIQETLQYGETPSPAAKGMFSGVHYEYLAEGSTEWSTEVPTTVGQHQVRAVGNGAFGERYGTEQTFTILPRTITVSAGQSSVRYGDIPIAYGNSLVFQDTVECDAYTYEDITQEQTKITPVQGRVIIRNAAGENVTSSYRIEVATTDITITKREVTITVDNVTMEYNGQPLTSEVYEITEGTLASGDRLSTRFTASQTDVGIAVNDPTLCVSNASGQVVTQHYQFTKIPGALTVSPRVLLVVTEGGVYTYDGEAHQNTEYVIDPSTSLLPGHTLHYVSGTTVTDVTDKPVENVLHFNILDADNQDITDTYYTIQLAMGMLEVKPRPVTITANNAEKTYDGTALTEGGCTTNENGLVEGHRVSFIGATSSLTNAGEIDNVVNPETAIIVDASGQNVTKNYLITGKNGTLTVSKREITYTSESASAVYNGTPFTSAPADITSGTLASGQVATLKHVSLTDIGTISNEFTVHITGLTGDVTDNYIVHRGFGTLTVTARPITITANSAEKVYDGEALALSTAFDNNAVSVGGTDNGVGLATGHYFRVVTNGSRIDVGTSANQVVSAVICNADGVNVTGNYDVAPYVDGSLTVTQRSVIITAKDATIEYNGSDLREGGVIVEDRNEDRGIIAGHTVSVTMTSDSVVRNTWDGIYGDGVVSNVIADGLIIYAADGITPVTDNYDVECRDGKLTILPRPVAVTVHDVNKVYNGVYDPTADTGWNTTSGTFVAGETLTATVVCSQADAGDGRQNTAWYTDLTDCAIAGGDMRNYDLTVHPGVLIITPRPMWIQAGSDTKTYDGTALTHGLYTYQQESGDVGLLDMHTIEAFMTSESFATHVSDNIVANAFDRGMTSIRVGQYGAYVNVGNYNIDYRSGTLQITKRAITIQVDGIEKTYDGTTNPLVSTSYSVTEGNFVTGENFLADVICSKADAGSTAEDAAWYTYLTNLRFDGDSGDLNNYDIQVKEGSLTIKKRHLTLTASSDYKVYDGTPLTDGRFTYEEENGERGLLNLHDIYVAMTADSTVTNVAEGYVANVIDLSTLSITWKSDGTPVDLNNYVVDGCADGALHIIKMEVTVKAQDVTKVYDGTTRPQKGESWILVSEDGFIAPETLIAELICSQITVGSTDEDSAWYTYLDDTTWYIENGSLDNYLIHKESGKLTITPRPIYITVGDYTRYYDGTTNVYNQDEVGYIVAGYDESGLSGLLAGHSLRDLVLIATTANANDNADAIANGDIWFTTIDTSLLKVFEGDVDVTRNYTYSTTDGALTILKRVVHVTVGDELDKVYDGTVDVGEDVTYAVDAPDETSGILSAHTLTAKVVGTTANANENQSAILAGDVWETTLADILVMYNGTEVTGNYTFDIDGGELYIARRKTTVAAGSTSKTYDGTPLSYGEIVGETMSIDTGLVTGHIVTGFTRGEITNAGKVANVVVREGLYILSSTGEDVTENYEITEYLDGVLEVFKRAVHITVDDAKKVYDGTTLLDNEQFFVKAAPGGMLQGHVLYAIVDANRADAGSGAGWETIIREGTLLVNNDEELTANYAFEVENGALIITARPVYVTVGDYTRVYDGTTNVYDESVGYTFATLDELSGLLEGHLITMMPPVKTSTANAGSGETEDLRWETLPGGDFTVMCGEDDMSGNYEFIPTGGALVITPRPVSISIGEVYKTYDGTMFYQGEVLVADSDEHTGLIDTHTLTAIVDGDCYIGTTTNVSFREGEDSIVIQDVKGNDVTANYVISCDNTGSLTIEKATLTIRTEGDKKEYDGTALTSPGYTASGYAEGQKVKLDVTGSQTEVGSSKNTVENVRVIDENDSETDDTGTLYIDYYNITYHLGDLIVTEPAETDEEDPEEEEEKSPGLSNDGTIGLPGDFEGSAESETLVAQIFTDITGKVYLRAWSHGDYDGQRWTTGTAYTFLIDETWGMTYLPGLALGEAECPTAVIEIKLFGTDYLLPYYLTTHPGQYDIQIGDLISEGDVDAVYSLDYYVYDAQGNRSLIASVPATYADVEAAYRTFVYANYLNITLDSTREYMNAIIAAEGFDKNDPDILAKVADYIKKAAIYNLSYNRELDIAEDVIVAFLMGTYGTDGVGEGICQHFASAATMLFRALGMPARYTVGYAVDAEADTWVSVYGANAHAWVEVYLDGIGWVQVEVTPAAGGTGGGDDGPVTPGPNEPDPPKPDEPDPPKPPEPDDEEIDENLTPIEVELLPVIGIYDGTPLTYIDGDWVMPELPDGWTFELDIQGSLTNVGVMDADDMARLNHAHFKVYDEAHNDVTSQYRLVFVGEMMEILPRSITFALDATIWTEDGEVKAEYSLRVLTDAPLAGHYVDEKQLVSAKYDNGTPKTDEILASIHILDSNNENADVTSNYDIQEIVVFYTTNK